MGHGCRSLKYTEPREQSASLLRLIIKEMGQHDAGFHPLSFAVWYEYLAGINPPLVQALDERRRAQGRLDDEAIEALYHTHVAEPDADVASQVGDRLQQVITAMSDSARTTGAAAGQFGEQLDGLARALAAEDREALAAQTRAAKEGTSQMHQQVDRLRSELDASRAEVDSLRGELARARVEALTDPLSGVLNRKGFDLELGALLAQPPAHGKVHCLILLDLDHFKRVNDRHGHLVGDSVLQALGQVLKRQVGEVGAVGARYGGEEFAILWASTTLKQAVELAERVRAKTKLLKVRDRSTNETLLTPTVSAGIAAWTPGEDASALIASADGALYRSKEMGRDRVTVA